MAAAETAGDAVRFRGITQLALAREGEDHEGLGDAEIAPRMAEEVKRRGWRGMPCACLLSGSATSTQSFLLPPMPDHELRQAIELKLDETLHFDVADAVFDFRRIHEYNSGVDDQTLVLVVAARKTAINNALLLLRGAGLRPTIVGAASESLANLSYYASLCGEGEATIHVDVGSDSTILNLFDGRLLRFSREVGVGGEDFTRALMRPIITPSGVVNLSHEQAEEVKIAAGYPRDAWRNGEAHDSESALPHGVRSSEILPLMEPVVQRLATEIRRSMDYLRGILKRQHVDHIILSGSAGKMRDLDIQLEEDLAIPVVHIDPVALATAHWRLAICDENPPSPAGFSAILGFSLGDHQPINLLPFEEMIQRVSATRKALVPSALGLGTCLALAGIPIGRTYSVAGELMQDTVEHLDKRLQAEAALLGDLDAVERTTRRVLAARGPVPDWIGIMKELPEILPEELQITSLISRWEDGLPIIHLEARIHDGGEHSATTIPRTTTALSASPFFTSVHMKTAAKAQQDKHGRYEARLEIVTAPRESLEDQQ